MQDSTVPQAQGDGDPRPVYRWRMGDGPVLVHVEKSGPAFPVPIAESLGRSLVAQTQRSVGEVLDAIQRQCFLDLMPAWTRLLRASGVKAQDRHRVCLRRDWFWGEMRDALTMALVLAEGDPVARDVRWVVADMLIRGEAVEAAQRCRKTLAELAEVSGSGATVMLLLGHLATYDDFAAGRA